MYSVYGETFLHKSLELKPSLQIINIRFTHLEIGSVVDEACGEAHDRLVVSEPGSQSCIKPHTLTYSTKGHQALITFTSNYHTDAQGFRAFYTAGENYFFQLFPPTPTRPSSLSSH